MLFKTKPKYLIIGLGNPGSKYEKTRHNAGFICADELVSFYGASPVKAKTNALAYKTVSGGREIYILKPLTFMNLSGQAVSEFMRFFKIPAQNIIVIYDDVSLDVGVIRIRPKGSAGGHNGISNIIQHIGTQEFLRIKIGVGKKTNAEYDLKDWVLSKFSADEYKQILSTASKVGDICNMLLDGQLDKARNMYNG